MLRTLLLEQGVRARLLSYPAGERRLTNILHLSELLHTMCVEHRLGITGTLKRLAEQIQNPDTTRSEQYEQRLESDRRSRAHRYYPQKQRARISDRLLPLQLE